jgi:hypothetical protein
MKPSILAFTVLVSFALGAIADAGQRTGTPARGTFRAGGRMAPSPRPTRSGQPDSGVRPLPTIPTATISPGWPRFSRTLWPFLFYGSIGLAYFDEDVPFTPQPNGRLGGLQLDIEPRRADVYVDGMHVGPVADFSGYYHHLDLTGGHHRLVVVADKYEPLIVDIIITPGRTETYRGTLSYARD